MKKIISVILLSAFLLSIFLASASAAENKLTMHEAYDIYREAYKRYSIFQSNSGTYDIVKADEKGEWVWEGHKQCIVYKDQFVLYHTFSNGKAYSDANGYYYAPFYTVPNFPSDFKTNESNTAVDEDFNYTFKSIEDVKNYFGEVFTDNMVEKNMYVPVIVLADSGKETVEKVELLRYSENNELLLYKNFSNYTRAEIACSWGPIAFELNAKKATLIVNYYAYGHDSYPESVEFVQENGVWKVSGGTVFGYLHGDHMANTLNYNPNTSDPTFHAIPALTVAALASLAIPAYVVRKRRRGV